MANTQRSPQDLVSVTASPISRFALLGGLLFILVLCLSLMWLNPNRTFPLVNSRSITSVQTSSPVVMIGNANSQSPMLYLSLPGAGNLADLYKYNPLSDTVPISLTLSAGISETIPILSNDNSTLAYFGVYSSGSADLFILSLSNGREIPLTGFTGTTKLHNGFEIAVNQSPVWSPDDAWIAFLARQSDGKGNAVELYLTQTTRPDLVALTSSGNTVSNPVWISKDEIAYVELHGDGKSVIQRRKITSNIQPTPIATILPSH